MEHYINNIRSLSGQGNFGQIAEFVSKSSDMLIKNPSQLDAALETFNVQKHSIGVLGILCAKYAIGSDSDSLLTASELFFDTCNGEQIRYATDRFAELCHKYCQLLISKRATLRGIAPLSRVISKVQVSPSQLTSVHADLCQLCLISKCFKPALQFLNADITEICPEGGSFDAKHFLLYYYYGGMIYASLKNYSRALFFFEIAVTTQSMAVSHIMIESYKKYLLVGLIQNGKVPTPPKYTSHVVAKYIKPLCQAYHDLANAYVTSKPDELQKIITRHTDTYNSDKNMGLVKQCLTTLYRKNIQRLTKTFLTLSLSDMANRVQLASARDAERHVLHMIEDGEIFASINQKDGMVKFHDNPERYNNPAMMARLDEQMERCMKLNDKLRSRDQEMTVNPVFVQKSLKNQDPDV